MKRLGADHVNKEEKEYECEPLDNCYLNKIKKRVIFVKINAEETDSSPRIF